MKTADFSNQIVMITGASSGLGRQLALDFAAAGAGLSSAMPQRQLKLWTRR